MDHVPSLYTGDRTGNQDNSEDVRKWQQPDKTMRKGTRICETKEIGLGQSDPSYLE